MAKLKTTRWDPAKHLATIADIAVYLDAAIEDGDPGLVGATLGDIARAKGMAQLAEKVGMSRTSLYKALSEEGRPEFATVLKVIDALGLQLRAEPRATKKRAKKAA
jgi:probable addiction module antidote protein